MQKIKMDLKRFFEIYGINKKPSFFQLIKYCIHPRFNCIFNYRLAVFLRRKKIPVIPNFIMLLNQFLHGIEFSMDTKIGGGLFIPHSFGVVIGADEIGENATIYQNVTLGAKNLDVPFHKENRPVIGNDVTIATGSVVLGRVFIGNRVIVAANSVVLHSVPDSVVVAGAPAKVLKENN
jgi:serine O-acetyltransferase